MNKNLSQIKDYELGDEIGAGRFGKVLKATKKNGNKTYKLSYLQLEKTE